MIDQKLVDATHELARIRGVGEKLVDCDPRFGPLVANLMGAADEMMDDALAQQRHYAGEMPWWQAMKATK